MPVRSVFFGIVITMYWPEHGRPHFHAKYGEHGATFDIETLAMLTGELASVSGVGEPETHSPIGVKYDPLGSEDCQAYWRRNFEPRSGRGWARFCVERLVPHILVWRDARSPHCAHLCRNRGIPGGTFRWSD